jgi:hypothetical protein
MRVFVDYRCVRCGGVSEHWVMAPPPAQTTCLVCQGPAQRRFSAPGLIGQDRYRAPEKPGGRSRKGAPCLDHPEVPGLCHLDPAIAPAWVARWRRDNRVLDRELAHQERSQREGTTFATVLAHQHHDHVHGSQSSHEER